MKKKLMQVVLTKDVDNLGKAGDVVGIKPGYGRNYLMPQNLAVLATKNALARAEQVREERKKKEKELVEKLKKQMTELKKLKLVFTEKVKEEDGKLYGSVGPAEIVKAAKEEGFELKKSWIDLKDHIKEVGKFTVEVKPHEDLEGMIDVEVKAEKAKKEEEESK